MNTRRFLPILLAFVITIGAPRLLAQTQTSGDLAGVVTDPTSAVVPGADVSLMDNSKGNTLETTTNGSGQYRFSLVAPGSYTLTATATGFQGISKVVQVALGTVTTSDVQLSIGTSTTTVSVNASVPLLKTENGDAATTIDERTVQEVPNPGNDIGFSAELAPGVVANTSGGGIGNFSSFGLGANANLFTINGMDDNDPFLNTSNSGATSLLLGNDEVQEVSVIGNGYSAEYGGLAGAQISILTSGGGNTLHGRATYYWNGRLFNANDTFLNASDTPRSFVNANSWGADMGGPVVKNKVWWYANTEGLYLVIPTSGSAQLPSSQFAAATEANIASRFGGGSPEEAFYKKMFNLWAGVPGYSTLPAVPGGSIEDGGQDGGCDGSETTFNTYLPGTTTPFGGDPGDSPCAVSFNSNVSAKTHDWIVTGRVDWNIDNNDRMFVRIDGEHGLQTSYIDPVSPLFNLVSSQPQYQGQYQWTRTLGSSAVNQFNLSGQWYTSTFNTPDLSASLAAFPTTIEFTGFPFYTPAGTALGGIDYVVPQGRNVTQYQVSDDFSKIIGNHSLKVGGKFRRNDITDYDNGTYTSGLLNVSTLDAFFQGGYDPNTSTGTGANTVNPNTTLLTQAFAASPVFHVASYTLAGYFEDDWKITPNLTLNLGLRLEHQSNPICTTDCFAAPVTQFTSLNHDPTIPYNEAIKTGLRQALPSLPAIDVQPRFGFAYTPHFAGIKDTVIRGGIGIFYDAFPDIVVDYFAENPPLYNEFVVGSPETPGYITPGGTNSLFTSAAASNTALVNGFDHGATLATLQDEVPGFTPPLLTGAQNNPEIPQVQKWSVEVQHAFGSNFSLDVGYVGNHAIHLPFFNNGLNAYFPGGFADLPLTAPDARFGAVTQINSTGISNYNGLVTSFKARFSSGEIQVNYTWSHAMDDSSNGGDPYVTYETTQYLAPNTSVTFPEDPYHPKKYNYGNADYDVRNYLSASYVWTLPIRRMLMGHGWARLVDGWQVSGTVFARSGTPYTLIDGATSGSTLGPFNYGIGEEIFGVQTGSSKGTPCAAPPPNGDLCLNTNNFATSSNGPGGTPNPLYGIGYGNVKRNSLIGPKLFNTDLTIMKYTKLPRWESAEFGLGFQFFNLFNHPNFQQPIGDVSSGQFGQILATVSSPTTIYGSGLGGDASPRLIQLKAQFRFLVTPDTDAF